MDTKNLKAYAPQARRDFIAAVTKRAAQFGLYEDRIADVVIEGSSAIIEGRVFTRKQAMQRGQLAKRIDELGFSQFINEAAFTWVNRLTAIRYMEVNGYLEHGFRILSMPPKKDAADNEVTAKFGEGFEILAHAADVAEHLELDKSNIVKMLLAGDKEEELYREILLGECHQLSKVMPFMFEKLNDATELLLPDNLTKTDSILKELVDKIPESDWQDIEVIGWLYQFYISDRKDAVMGTVVKKEDIPAATQLFTPNWIVKYLVQNSVGSQWLATYPESELKDKMEYYIAPAEQSDDVIAQLKAITPTSIDPETIKVLDPACGSGHILVEVYEVLREIYLERGYRLREIPELILTKNIYGLDIDDRAAQMAAFAVLMKAREDDHRIFDRIASNDIVLNIHSLQPTEHLDINQLWFDLDFDDKHQAGSMSGLFDEAQNITVTNTENDIYLQLLRYLDVQFTHAKTLGSLIQIDNSNLDCLLALRELLIVKSKCSNPSSKVAANVLLPIVHQAIVLGTRYNSLIANPPYMGSSYMNSTLKQFVSKEFKGYAHDLFECFMVNGLRLVDNGYSAMVTLQSWMYLGSYSSFRSMLTKNKQIHSLLHLGNHVMGINFGACASVLSNTHISNYKGHFTSATFKDLVNGSPLSFPISSDHINYVYPSQFSKVNGSPIIYQAPEFVFSIFDGSKLNQQASPYIGIQSGDNLLHYRFWTEINSSLINKNLSCFEELTGNEKWIPLYHGGEAIPWSGNGFSVVNMKNKGSKILATPNGALRNSSKYFNNCITWNRVNTQNFVCRKVNQGFAFDDVSPFIVPNKNINIDLMLGVLNSSAFRYFHNLSNGTNKTEVGLVSNLPLPDLNLAKKEFVDCCEEQSRIAQQFSLYSELSPEFSFSLSRINTLKTCFHNENEKLELLYQKFKDNSEKINSYAADLYGVSRYIDYFEDANINLKLNEVVLDVDYLVSFSIGCMMGRYSPNSEGLVYAHSNNEGFNNLVIEGVYKTFPADDDGIIPLASEAWLFDDDATARFREFVKTVWGEEHLSENLDFVAESLCLNAIKPKNGESSLNTIRRYLSTQFYKDHLKTYKKRPVYWLFSSGKEKAFECLIYLHRYNEGTLSRMRTEYVTPLMGKFESQTSILRDERDSASSSEQRRIDKDLKSIEKKQAELRTFDEELKHISEMKISLDLDDGVKVNYGKFGNLLANVKDIHGKKPEVIK
jgi:type I restriction-modification system DNA methylase subunit